MHAQGRCLLMASMTSMAQNQLLDIVRGSPWHAAVLRMLGAQVGRGVFLDSLLLLVRRQRSLLLASSLGTVTCHPVLKGHLECLSLPTTVGLR